jgi:hypothetical protein
VDLISRTRAGQLQYRLEALEKASKAAAESSDDARQATVGRRPFAQSFNSGTIQTRVRKRPTSNRADCREALMGKCAGARNNGAAITRAMLALEATGLDVGRRRGKWLPPFNEPLWLVGLGRVLGTRDFSANGPIQMGEGFWTHANSSLACEERVPVSLNACGSEARK